MYNSTVSMRIVYFFVSNVYRVCVQFFFFRHPLHLRYAGSFFYFFIFMCNMRLARLMYVCCYSIIVVKTLVVKTLVVKTLVKMCNMRLARLDVRLLLLNNSSKDNSSKDNSSKDTSSKDTSKDVQHETCASRCTFVVTQ